MTLLVCWLGLLLAIYGRPYNFSLSTEVLTTRLEAAVWIPFTDPFSKEAVNPPLFVDVLLWWIVKACFFLPLGFLAHVVVRRGSESHVVAELLLLLGFPVLLAAMRFFLPYSLPSMTDVVIGIVGGFWGRMLAQSLRGEPVRPSLLAFPLFWLFFQAAILLLAIGFWPQFEPVEWQYTDDGYVQMPVASELTLDAWTESLTHQKSVGYSWYLFLYRALLKKTELEPTTFNRAPLFEGVIRFLVTLVFFVGLRCLSLGGWLAMAISSCLLYSTTFHNYLRYVMSDPLAESLCILSVGCLLVLVGRPRSVLSWAGLTFGVLASCLVRPPYAYLTAFLPVLGVLLRGLLFPEPGWLLRSKWLAAGLVAACALPLIGFCSLRWTLVGDFAMNSSSGTSLFGIAGQFLTEEKVPQLPAELQDFARTVLRIRKGLEDWRPALDEEGHLLPHVENDWNDASLGVGDMFNRTIVELGYPAVVEAYQLDFSFEKHMYHQNHILLDRKMKELAVAIIKADSTPYVEWLARAAVYSLQWVPTHANFFLRLGGGLLLGMAAWHSLYLLRAFGIVRAIPAGLVETSPSYTVVLQSFLVLTLGHALGGVVPVLFAAYPSCRYIDAAGTFLPCIVMVGLFALGSKFRQLLPTSGGLASKP